MKFEVGDIIRIKNEEPLIILSTPIKDAQIKADNAGDLNELKKIFTLTASLSVYAKKPKEEITIKDVYALFTDDGYRKIGKIDELENI